MSDLISRQAAIDAIGKASDELYENIKKVLRFHNGSGLMGWRTPKVF